MTRSRPRDVRLRTGSDVVDHDEIGPASDSIELDNIYDSRANITNAIEYPEGGLEAWLVVLGAFCAQFLVFGMVNTTAVFQSYLSTHELQGDSPTKIGWIFSTNLFLTFCCGIYSGSVFDKHGPKMLVACGTFLLVLSMMLLGLCYEYWHYMLTYGVLAGFGGALLMTPTLATIGHWFDRRRAFATGIANTSGSVGGIIIPLMLQRLNVDVGFAWSTRIVAFVFVVMAIPANLFLKTRLPPSANRPSSLWPDFTIFTDQSFAICSAGMFLMEWGLFVVLAYIASYIDSKGDIGLTGYTVVALLNAGSFFGRWMPGLLADRFGRFNVILITIFLCATTIFAFWLPAGDSVVLISVFAVTFGFASGSNLGLIPVCLSQLCPADAYGRYLSSAYFFTSFGTLTSVPIGGAILKACNGNYTGLIVFSAAAYAGALVCYVASRGLAAGVSLKKKF